MGYTTDFTGSFKLNKKLDAKTSELIDGLNKTRRMKRDLTKLGMSKAEAASYGTEGEFYVASRKNHGQDKDASILDYNNPPSTQPGLWCQWRYSEKNQSIKWDGGEKFYNYIEWIQYLVKNVLSPEYILNGKVRFDGEDGANGYIKIENNVIRILNSNHVQW